MSADRLTDCPVCTAVYRRAAEQARIEAAEAYGKVPFDEYAELLAASKAPRPDLATLAEYYSIHGAETGTVTVEYGARCDVCELSFSFKTEHQIPGAE